MFADEVLEWPWLPHFQHLPIAQSAATVDAIRGELNGRIAQFTMMAVYPDHWSVLQRVVPLSAHPYRR